MEKQKIVYVITQAEWGGAQKYVFELTTSLEAENSEIYVIVGRNKDRALIDRLNGQTIKVIELKHLVRPMSLINDILAVFELRKIYQRIKPDVIHLNSSKAGVVGSLANIIWGKITPRVIYTAHGWAFNEPMWFLKKLLYLDLEIITAWFKNVIICVSDFDRQAAIKYKIAKAPKLITIRNGLEVQAISFFSQEEAKEKLNLPAEKIIVGTIANFYNTKGLEYFIKAISELKNDQVIGVIMGDGELRPQLEKLIEQLKINHQIILLGQKSNAAQYLKALNIYVSASIKEGFPYAILEAMAAELPIIATNVGGVPEMVSNEKNGILIDNNEIAKALARQAKQDVTDKFSLDNMIKKTFSQY